MAGKGIRVARIHQNSSALSRWQTQLFLAIQYRCRAGSRLCKHARDAGARRQFCQHHIRAVLVFNASRQGAKAHPCHIGQRGKLRWSQGGLCHIQAPLLG